MRITAILFVDENGPVPPVPICNPKSDLPLAQADTGSINARSLTARCSDVFFFNSSTLVIARQRQKGTGRGKRPKGMIEMNWVASSELLYQASSRAGSAVGFGTLDVGWNISLSILFSLRASTSGHAVFMHYIFVMRRRETVAFPITLSLRCRLVHILIT